MTTEATTTPAPTPATPAPSKREIAVAGLKAAKEVTAPEAKVEPAKAEPEKPSTLPTLDVPEVVKPSHELAIIARENRKVLAEKEGLKKLAAETAARAAAMDADLKIAQRIKAKDFSVLTELDKDWYQSASKFVVAQAKPDSPEALALKFEKRFEDLSKQLEQALKPKEAPRTEEPAVSPEVASQREAAYRASVAEHVKTVDAFKGEFEGEPISPEAVAKTAVDHVDQLIRIRQAKNPKYAPDIDEINKLVIDALGELQTKITAKRDLTKTESVESTDTAATRKSGESGAAQPQQTTSRQGSKNLTDSLHDAVPVKAGPKTREERRNAAIELLRRQREAEV